MKKNTFQLSLLSGLLIAAFSSASISAQSVSATPPASSTAASSTASDKILAGDDFFTFINKDWLQKAEIPADRGSWSAFGELADQTNQKLVAMIGDLSNQKKLSKDTIKVRDFYASIMDEARIESQGLKSLMPQIKRIEQIPNARILAEVLGASVRVDVDPLNAGNYYTENLFGIWIGQGFQDPEHNHAYLLQGGLGMPDKAYYVTQSADMEKTREAYQDHIAKILTLAGYNDAATRAAKVFALEAKIAQTHVNREDSDNVLKANNPWSPADFAKKAPGMDWHAFLKGAGLRNAKIINAWHPSAITGVSALVANTDLAIWKDYLIFHALNAHSEALPKAYSQQHFAFYDATLSGTPQQSERSKRALVATDNALGEAIGHLYVDRYFPAENKARLQKMVANIINAFSLRIDKLDWMNPATRAQAKEKLKTLYVGIGYPERWQSFDKLQIDTGDALGNMLRAEQFHTQQELARLSKPVDKKAWAMSSHVINAVNLPLQNAMNFPAAILQAPFFDAAASDAQNYGGIGAVIGHEISHSFDDQGSQFDAQGRLRDWWTKDDLAHFKTAGAAVVAQYSAYQAFPDLAVNGQLTLNENLADLAGVSAALDAFHASLGNPADTSKADREFFTGFAQIWRVKAREASLRRTILTNGHAPGQYRAAVVRNLDAWYKAFDVQAGQKLYLAPEARIKVW